MHDLPFLQNMHAEHLTTIGDVHLTHREVDVISCLLNMRGASKIAGLLSISPNTVSTHIQNIIFKLGCGSREGIIDYVEKSNKLFFIKKYYTKLVIHAAFKKSLQDIAKIKRAENDIYFIVYGKDQAHKDAFVHHLEIHLKQAGIYSHFQEENTTSKEEEAKNKSLTFLLFLNKVDQTSLPKKFYELDSINIFKHKNYYLSVFTILKKFCSSATFEKIYENFIAQYEGMYGPTEDEYLQNDKGELEQNENIRVYKPIQTLKNKKLLLVLAPLFIGICYLHIQKKAPLTKEKVPVYTQDPQQPSLRSDLAMPTKTSFLNRPVLISHLNNMFNKQEDIPIIALVGPGGSGKTILARYYGSQQNSPLIWEINAETIDSLKSSFEILALALTKTAQDQKILGNIQEIANSIERENKILYFVKEKLKSYLHWFLIYDNVENLTNIQRYFPQNVNFWGKGSVLITTRDNHIKNNRLVHHTLQIGELNPQESLALFTKIMSESNSIQLEPDQIEQAKAFLSNLPPFPLDISMAAYYLKSANIPYETYLERLNGYNKDFVSIQEKVLKEVSEYTKTRYNIITLSLKNLIASHKDFEELLLFISLLDSQHIPRNLLDASKNGIAVDDFLYFLKKYSLITSESSVISHSIATFSIHRSTQEIILLHLISTLDLKRKNELLTSISYTLTNHMTSITDEEDFPMIKALVRHCETFLVHHTLFSAKIRSSIEGRLGAMYHSLRYYSKGQQILEKSFLELAKHPVESHHQIIDVLAYLTTIYMELGNHEEAQNIIEKRVVPYKVYFSEIHPHIARALTYLGDVSTILGNYEKAKTLLEQSFNLYEKHFPTQYFWLARTSASLGNTYIELGKYEKAKNILEKALLIHKTHTLKNRLDVAWISTFLANVYEKLGGYEIAKQLLEEAIVIAKQHLPDNHIDIGWITVFLGNVYRELGQLEKAKNLLEQTLIVHREVCGEENVRTASVLIALGSIYKDLGQYEKAKVFLNKGLVIYEKEFGKSHIETARILRELGQTYSLEDRLESAENLMNTALKIFQENHHPEAYLSLEILAELSLQQSTKATQEENLRLSLKKAAVDYLTQALETVESHFPKGSPHKERIETKLKKARL